MSNNDIIWTVHKGQLGRFQESKCIDCGSEYVLPIMINTDVKVEIDGYMTKAKHDEIFR